MGQVVNLRGIGSPAGRSRSRSRTRKIPQGAPVSYSGGNHAFFNANTGDVWEYGDHGNFRNHYKVSEMGHDDGR
jgi:hypothetical protein